MVCSRLSGTENPRFLGSDSGYSLDSGSERVNSQHGLLAHEGESARRLGSHEDLSAQEASDTKQAL